MSTTSHAKHPSRRRFLLAGGAAALVSLDSSTAIAQAGGGEYPFTLGVASGDPTPDGVVLWTRLAPDPLNGGGMPGWPVLVRWQVALDDRMQQVVRQGVAIARPALAHSVHVEVEGLEPDRWYYYRFTAGAHASTVGRTRTMPRAGREPDTFRFAFVSCQDWQNGYYSAFRNLAREDVDLVVHLGDYIYEYGAEPTAVRPHLGGETMTLVDYRNRYAQYRTDAHLRAAHAAFPWLVVPDDHEVENNYAGRVSEDNVDRAAFLERRANAYRAYYEHMPLRREASPEESDARFYRALSVGQLIAFSALDTRQYRSDQPCGDGLQFPCAGQYDLAQTMMGPAQERWLQHRLHNSNARWNVIAQQTMFAPFDFLAGPAQLFNMDQWDGYIAARARLTAFMQLLSVSNPIVLTGDIHSSWVHDIKANYADAASPVVGTEFVGTSITSSFPPELVPPVLAALGDNPHTRFFDGLFRGYVRCTVTPTSWVSDFRAVPTILTDDVDAFTLASFAVADGVPGAVPL
jgi:alkaline phosphatase D